MNISAMFYPMVILTVDLLLISTRTVFSVKYKINNITDKTCYDEADHIFVADFTLLKGHILFQVIQGNKLPEFDNFKILVKLDV